MINRSLFALIATLCLLLPAKGQIKADYELPSIPAGKYLERLRAFTTQEFKRVDLVRLKPQGTAEDPEWNTILDENGKVDKQRIESRVPITGETLTEIFKVFFDLGDEADENMCYNPRNGILFFDASGKYLGFIELCFECYNMHHSPSLPLYQTPDYDGFKKLLEIFAQYEVSTEK